MKNFYKFRRGFVHLLLPLIIVAAVLFLAVNVFGFKNKLLSTLSSIRNQSAFAAAAPLVGAIRWDVWNDGPNGILMEQILSPQQWHDRLPFYTNVISDNEVQIRSDTQVVMDQEIAYAKAGGINYWAFDYYELPTPMNRSFNLYLSSSHKSDINFVLDLQGQWLGSKDAWPQTVAKFVNWFKDSSYQKVAGGRPLVYLLNAQGLERTFGSYAEARTAFDTLRTETIAAGLPTPYIALQENNASYAANLLDTLGFDALSSYAVPLSGNADQEYPYSDLVAFNHQFWNNLKATGKKVIPIVNSGWDPRPIWANPPSWYPSTHTPYFTNATPQEVADNVRAAMDWDLVNPNVADANTVLVYAWNEFSEGGWIAPLIESAGGTARLDAIKAAIDAGPRVDIVQPDVSITAPANSANVSGTVAVSADASDNVAVAGVQFKLDGTNLGAEVTTSPYNFSWDSATVTNGQHTLVAIARDTAGNTKDSTGVTVNVNNAIATQPVGKWSMNEWQGTVAGDSSGNSNNGALVGGATWVTGKNGSGVNFNGVDGNVSIPDGAVLDNTKAVTVSAWVNLSQLPTQNYVPVGKDDNGASYRITIGPSGKASFTVSTTNNGWYTIGTNVSSLTSLPVNIWKHIVGTYDGNYVRIYVDGVLENTASQVISGNIVNSASALHFGYKSSANIDYMKGIVDESSVYSVALSPNEVKALYDSTNQNADITAPTASITTPANNATVNGTVNVTADAADAGGINKVEFYADGGLIGTDTTSPYSASWNTSSYPNNSSHILSAKAYDNVGNMTSSSTISVTVADVTAPTVSITSPANNSIVSRNSTVTIIASASDGTGVSKVEFYVNSSLKCTDTVVVYSCAWRVSSAKNVTYSLVAKAYDAANNVGTSSTVTVTSK